MQTDYKVVYLSVFGGLFSLIIMFLIYYRFILIKNKFLLFKAVENSRVYPNFSSITPSSISADEITFTTTTTRRTKKIPNLYEDVFSGEEEEGGGTSSALVAITNNSANLKIDVFTEEEKQFYDENSKKRIKKPFKV
jgi:hypothetical protein